MSYSRSADRSALGFADAARQAFGFVYQFGFRELRMEDTIVRYVSDRMFLNVYHGRSSYELGIEIGVADPKVETRGHSMSALLRASDPQKGNAYRNRIATTPEEVKRGLVLLANDLETYGIQALRGNRAFFALLEKQRQDWAEEYAADVAYRQTLPRADAAFRLHDYETAAKLYKSIQNRLSPAELKKLEYASKHK